VQPLSPVHLRVDFHADGALTLSWIRRSRIGGDNWDGVEVPLGEERELYSVVVGNASGTVLTRQSTEPTLTVSAAEQADAFGALPPQLIVRIAQASPVWGDGIPTVQTFARPG
jgi:hypothetical protein